MKRIIVSAFAFGDACPLCSIDEAYSLAILNANGILKFVTDNYEDNFWFFFLWY